MRPSTRSTSRSGQRRHEAERAKLLGDAQRMLATDAVAGFLFQPQWITIANKKLKGVWKEVPQFENDFSAWSWD